MDATWSLDQRKERAFSRRQMLIGGALLGVSALSFAMIPRRPVDLLGGGQLDALIPVRVGPWSFLSKSGLVLPPRDQLVDLIYDQLLTRVYSAPGLPPIMLLIAQSPAQDGVIQIHRPEFCYPAGGFTLSGGRLLPIAIPGREPVPARFLTATSPERIEQLLYWTRVGRDLPTNWREQRLAVAQANLRGEIPDGMMVRLSVITPNPAEAAELMTRFTGDLIASVSPKTRLALIGA
jgi:EpsI family protein